MDAHREDVEKTALVVREEFEEFLPALSVEQAVSRFRAVVDFVQTVMKANVDYGVIPGTAKPTLLKPGAEKLCTLFGLSARFHIIERIEDWTGERFGGEPFFYYLYRCQLSRGEVTIAEADGSCNSRETKYRYRKADRACPVCGQATIIRGREEFGGGWICFAKKGGCGAKYRTGDPSIEGQQVGRVTNPDIADQVNTIQKMGQKRSLIAACLIAANASEFFTQDVEEMFGPGAGPPPVEAPRHDRPAPPPPGGLTLAQACRFNAAWADAGLDDDARWAEFAAAFRISRLDELPSARFEEAMEWVAARTRP